MYPSYHMPFEMCGDVILSRDINEGGPRARVVDRHIVPGDTAKATRSNSSI
jgi:hypothetical protein